MVLNEEAKKSPDVDTHQRDSVVERELKLGVILPDGVEITAAIPGSKPVIDLLVILCAKYHLNPPNHTIELISASGDCVKFKPNAPIGTLEAQKIQIKPKGSGDRNKKESPKMPEATVRLVINYKTTYKTVLRVNPHVPIDELLPAICAKCELNQSTTVLARNQRAEEHLDLGLSLNDFGLREVYAVETKGVKFEESLVPPRHGDDKSSISEDKALKDNENKGLFSNCRRNKKMLEEVVTVSGPASPAVPNETSGSVTSLSGHASTHSSYAPQSVTPKKRPAPPPPMTVSHIFSSSLGNEQMDSKSQAIPNNSQKESVSSHGFLEGCRRRAPTPPIKTAAESRLRESIQVGIQRGLDKEEMADNGDVECSTVPATKENAKTLKLCTSLSVDSGNIEPILPPAETETQEGEKTSMKHGIGDDQLELDPDINKYVMETMKANENKTSDLENKGRSHDSITSKEECYFRGLLPALLEESPVHQSQNGGRSSPYSTKDGELHRNPCIEVVRKCVPKAGFITYTIAPSESPKKLKYFEVEVILEKPTVVLKENEASGSTEPGNHYPRSDEPKVSVVQSQSSTAEGEELDCETSEQSDCGHIAQILPPSNEHSESEEQNIQTASSHNKVFKAGPGLDKKSMKHKIPPAKKPISEYFHQPQQIGTSVKCGSSEATKSEMYAISQGAPEEGFRRVGKEALMTAKRGNDLSPPPSPLSGVAKQEVTKLPRKDELKSEATSCPSDDYITKCCTNELELLTGPSLRELAILSTPKLCKPAEPSAFSKAVFTAVKKCPGFTPTSQLSTSRMSISMRVNKGK